MMKRDGGRAVWAMFLKGWFSRKKKKGARLEMGPARKLGRHVRKEMPLKKVRVKGFKAFGQARPTQTSLFGEGHLILGRRLLGSTLKLYSLMGFGGERVSAVNLPYSTKIGATIGEKVVKNSPVRTKEKLAPRRALLGGEGALDGRGFDPKNPEKRPIEPKKKSSPLLRI